MNPPGTTPDQSVRGRGAHSPRSLLERAYTKAREYFPDTVTHDYDPGPGIPKHPLGRIEVDRGNLRYAFAAGVRWALQEVARADGVEGESSREADQ